MDQLDQQKESHDENDVAAADDDENDNHVATVNAVLNTTERADHPMCADNEGRLVNFPKKLDDDHDHKIHQQAVNANTQNAVADEEEVQPIPSAVTETLPHNHNDHDTDNDHNIDGMLLLPPNDYGRKSNYYNMSRQSTVSSLAGNSIDLGITGVGDITDDPMNDDSDDDIDDHINIDHVVLNALPENVLLDRVRFPEDLSLNNNNNNMEERSIRSDRPDPPPSSDIIMTMLPMENHNSSSDNNIDTTEMNADPNVTTTSHYHDNDTNNNNNPIITKQQHRHVTTAEENFAVEALASLSINMAEITLSEEYNPINNSNNNTLVQQQQQAPDPSATVGNVHHLQHDIMNNEWDMNRPALLAETPNIVTLRKTSSLKAMAYQNNTSSNTDNDHFHVDGNNHSNTTIPYHRSLSVPKIYNVPTTTSTMQYTNNPIVSSNLDNTIATTTTTDTVHVGADHLIVLPRVDEGNRFFYHPPNTNPQQYQYTSTDIPPPPQNQLKQPNIPHNHMPNITTMKNNNMTNSTGHHSSNKTPSGRRKIRLRLQEEIRNNNATNITKKRHTRSTSLLGSIRKSSTRMLRFSGVGSGGVGSNGMSFLSNWEEEEDNFDAMTTNNNLYTIVDRGHLMVGWFDGTSTFELQQHIHKSVLRKLQQLFSVVGDNNKNGNNASDIIDIEDLRILDESFDPPEDVVLSPHIPDGSHFLLRFGTIRAGKAKKNETRMKMDYHDGTMTPMSIYSGRAPDSPSAAPSPHLDKFLVNGLNANQIALLNSLNIPTDKPMNRRSSTTLKNQIEPPPQDGTRRASTDKYSETEPTDANQAPHPKDASGTNNDEGHEESSKRIDSNGGQFLSEISSDDDENADDATMMLHSDDPIEARLREITDLLLLDRKKERYRRYDRQREKRQVVFVVANYFVLFLAIIAISAELQARAPNWIKMMEEHLQNVQNCSENHEALFECVSRGDFAGLIASVVLWLSRSVTTKRIFLFGFDTPKKLWTVVYESLVTSVCWGISYLFIRRGMNPDTRPRFVQKYWKDAVYGSLAGFNAAFLKHILKNLIPEQVVEDALRERQLKIMGWLPSFHFR